MDSCVQSDVLHNVKWDHLLPTDDMDAKLASWCRLVVASAPP